MNFSREISCLSCFCWSNSSTQDDPLIEMAKSCAGGQEEAVLGKLLPPETIAEAISGTSGSSSRSSLESMNISHISGADTVAGSAIEEADGEDLKQMDGSLWECVQKIKASGGHIYRYRLKDKFDPIYYLRGSSLSKTAREEMNKLCHPAVEWSGLLENPEVRGEFGEFDLLPWVSQKAKDMLRTLGYKREYSLEGVFTEYPDQALIESRWMSIMDCQPDWNLRKLNIKSCGQILSDREFIDAFCEYDVLLSTGSEFVHDHQAHVIAKIQFIVNHPLEYVESKKKLVGVIKKITDSIDVARDWLTAELRKEQLSNEDPIYLARLKKNLEHADVIPAIYVDNFAAIPSPEDVDKILGSFASPRIIMFSFFGNDIEAYSGYLKRRFPDEEISMPWLCDEIAKILRKVERKGYDSQIL